MDVFLYAGAHSPLTTPLSKPKIATRERLAEAFRLPAVAPRVLRLDPRQPLGYARDLDVLPNTLPPERHLGYAVQGLRP